MERELKNMKKFINILLIMSLVILLYVIISFFNLNNQFNDIDKVTILKLALETSLKDEYIPFSLLKNQNYSTIIISDENISDIKDINFQNYKFKIMPLKEIENKAREEGDFLYIRVSEYNISRSKAIITIENISTGSNYQVGGYMRFILKKSNNRISIQVDDGGKY